MSNRIPGLGALRVFEAAARHRSFKKAAQELCVTPAAVSHQLSQLEAQLGVLLFKRLNQGIELTPAARICLPKLQEGLDCVRESVEQIRQHVATETIKVSAPPTFAMRWLMPRLHHFILAHPDLDVQVSTRMGPFRGVSGSRRAIDDVHAWTAESDVVMMYGWGDYPDLHVDKLMPLTITPMCSPGRLRQREMAQPDDLRLHDLLHDDRGTMYSTRSFWRHWLEAAGADDVDAEQGPRFTHALLALGAAVEGGGVVASTPVLALDDLAAGRLVMPFALQVPLDSGYYAVTSEAAHRRDDVMLFQRWLRAEAQASNDSCVTLARYA